jgi:hypothetical protein
MLLKQLLNTISNLGGTWPRFFVLKGVDMFSVATCHVKQEGSEIIMRGASNISHVFYHSGSLTLQPPSVSLIMVKRHALI